MNELTDVKSGALSLSPGCVTLGTWILSLPRDSPVKGRVRFSKGLSSLLSLDSMTHSHKKGTGLPASTLALILASAE